MDSEHWLQYCFCRPACSVYISNQIGSNLLNNKGQKATDRLLKQWLKTTNIPRIILLKHYNSSAVAEMGDRGHNRHGPKREGVLCPSHGALGTRVIQCGLHRGLLPYQVTSSSIEPFGQNSAGCHSPRRNVSTNYYLVVEMHTVTVRSYDARYLLN